MRKMKFRFQVPPIGEFYPIYGVIECSSDALQLIITLVLKISEFISQPYI